MSREIDKAFLKVYDGNNLGKASPEAVRIAKYYFTMGYEAAQQKHEADGGCPLPASIQEALNSGDGTYRP